MAWQETVVSAKLTAKLDDGTTATGTTRTVNVSMGTLNPSAWDLDKAGAIILALRPCLNKTLVQVIHGVDNSVDNNG